MKKNGLRYQIGQINGWNEIAMQVNNVYIEQMKKLNEEEKEIRSDYDEEKLENFYQRKNELALKFIQAINNGEIKDEDIGIIYLENDSEDMYWDKILIDINKAYDENRYVQYEDSFVILPPVIASMDEGNKALHDFLKSHIKEKYDAIGMMDQSDLEEWNSMTFSKNMFDWQLPTGDIQSEIRLNQRVEISNTDLEKYASIMENDERREIEEHIAKYPEELEMQIQDDMKKYDFSREEAIEVENYIESHRRELRDEYLPKVKKVIGKLREDYGKEFVENHEVLSEMNYSLIKGDMSNLAENIYNARKRDPEFDDLISNLKFSDKIIDKILSGNDEVELVALAMNPNITVEQAEELRKKAPTIKGKYELLCNLAKSGNLLEEDIRDMYNGDEDEHKAVLNYSSELPNDLVENEINNVVDLFNQFSKDGNQQNVHTICENGRMLCNELKNNMRIPLEIIEKYYNCIKQMMEVKTEYALRNMSKESMGAIFVQENLDETLIKEIATKYARTSNYFGAVENDVVCQYFKNPDRYPNLIDIFANNEDKYVRMEVAEAYLDGRCEKLDKEIVNKLAQDPEIKMNIRLKLQETPEYEEIFSKNDADLSFRYDYRDSDNNTRTYSINGKEIMRMQDQYLMYIEDFERFCNEHEDAIATILENDEEVYSREELKQRVNIVEGLLEREEKISEEDKKFVTEVVDKANKKKQLEKTKVEAEKLLQEYKNMDKSQGQSLND